MSLSCKQKKTLKVCAIVAGSLVALLLVVLLAVRIILTDKVLTNLVNKYSNEYLNAKVKIDTVSLQLFSDFPYVGVKLINGEIISNAFAGESDSLKSLLPSKADSLISFKELVLSFSLPHLVAQKVDIKRIRMVTPRIYAYVSPWGKTNWDIVKVSDTSAVSNDDSSFDLSINVDRINIKDKGVIVYDSRPDSLMATISLNQMRLKGKLTMDKNKLVFNKGYFSKFSVTVEQLLAQKSLSPMFNNLPDSISVKKEYIGGGLKRATASVMIDSMHIESGKRGDFRIDAVTHSNLKIGDVILAKDLPLEINGGVMFDTSAKNIVTFKDLKIVAAEIPLRLNGKVRISKDSLYTNDLCGKVDDFELSHFFKYIPKQIFPNVDKIVTDAKFTVDLDVNGSLNFNTGAIPSFVAQLNIPSSKIAFKGAKVGIKELAADIKGYYNAQNPDSSGLDIKQFLIDGIGIKIDTKGSIKNIVGDPFINLDVFSYVSLDTLGALFPPKKSDLKISGALKSDFTVKSLLSNLKPYKLADANIHGDLDSDSLNIQLPSKDFYCMIKNVCFKMSADKNTKDESIAKGTKMLGGSLTIDSIYFKKTDSLVLRGHKIRIAGHNAASVLKGDKSVVHPFNGIISADMFECDGIDSSRLRIRDTKNTFSILPYKGNMSIPIIRVSSTNGRLSARSNINRFSLRKGVITFEAIMHSGQDKVAQAKRERRLDSLQQIYPFVKRDSLILHSRKLRGKKDDFAGEDINIGIEDKTLVYFIREWDMRGNIKAASGRVTTPYFPLRNNLKDIDMFFSSDSIKFNNTYFKLGETVITATGYVSGMKRAMLGGSRGRIKADFKIDSDTLNFNELVYAATKGGEYMSSSDEYKESLMEMGEEKLQNTITGKGNDSLQKLDLIIIPGNIDAKINLNVDYGKYSNLILNKVEGDLIAKNRCLQINGFRAITSAGELDIDAFYSTKGKHDIAAGFDMEMKNMNVKQLIDLVPGVDTLLPMLRSFDGMFNCQMAATTQMDTAMNVIFPTMRGVARIKGDNLILMDGETFASISKMLRFKNREKNMVDNISVEIMVSDNKIEVFPFIMQIDRYQTAISGEQDLDLNFKYHISVLKSPIPIRLGVNVFGSLDKFDYKIGKAKYKNSNLPVYTQVIDDTRVNLRSYITNIFNRGVDAALRNGTSTDKIDELRKKHLAIESDTLEQLTAQDSLLLGH